MPDDAELYYYDDETSIHHFGERTFTTADLDALSSEDFLTLSQTVVNQKDLANALHKLSAAAKPKPMLDLEFGYMSLPPIVRVSSNGEPTKEPPVSTAYDQNPQVVYQKDRAQPDQRSLRERRGFPPIVRRPIHPGPNAPINRHEQDREWSYRFELMLKSVGRPDERTIRGHMERIRLALAMTYGRAVVSVTHGGSVATDTDATPGFTDADARNLLEQIATGNVRNPQLAAERFLRGPVS